MILQDAEGQTTVRARSTDPAETIAWGGERVLLAAPPAAASAASARLCAPGFDSGPISTHSVWYSAYWGGNHVGRLDPVTGTFRRFPLPDPDGKRACNYAACACFGGAGVTVDPSGAVWFADYFRHRLGRLRKL